MKVFAKTSLFTLIAAFAKNVSGHGFVSDPPARNM